MLGIMKSMQTYDDSIRALSKVGYTVIIDVRGGAEGKRRWNSKYADIETALQYLDRPTVSKKDVKLGIHTINGETTFVFIFQEDNPCKDCSGRALGLCSSCVRLEGEEAQEDYDPDLPCNKKGCSMSFRACCCGCDEMLAYEAKKKGETNGAS